MVGAGRVAARRLGPLLEAGALITVIAPKAVGSITELATSGALTWVPRSYADGDLDGAWYVLVAADDHDCNERVSAEAERRRIFCVRSDDRHAATAWTPATGTVGDVQLGVLAGGDHTRSRQLRDQLLQQLTG